MHWAAIQIGFLRSLAVDSTDILKALLSCRSHPLGFWKGLPDKHNRMILGELLVRVSAAALLGGACLFWPSGGFVPAVLGFSLFVLSGSAAALLEKRHMRGPLAAASVAALDTMGLACFLAALDALLPAGAILAAPSLWAVSRFSANPLLLAPVAGGIFAAASSIWLKDGFSPPLYPGLLTIVLSVPLSAGGLISRRREVHIEPVTEEATISEESDDLLELREAYRALRDQYHLLEQKSRTGRLAKSLLEGAFATSPWQKLADALCAETGALGLRIYASSISSSKLVWRASSGVCRDAVDGPQAASGTMIGSKAIKRRLESLATALKQDTPREPTSSILVREKGKVVGLIMVDGRTDSHLAQAEERLRPALSLIGKTFIHLSRRSDEERRSRESEILYSVLSLAKGAASQQVIAERTAGSLMEVVPADSLSISLLKDSEAKTIAHLGRGVEPLNLHSFAHGAGWLGWLRSGAPEILVMDPAEDMRVDQDEALRSRVRSLCVVPLTADGETIGWLSASSPRSGALDESHLTTLRIACCELGPALKTSARAMAHVGSGLASPREFVRALKDVSRGTLVAVEIVGMEDLRRRFGAAALAQAISRTTTLINSKAPAKSLICRRDEGAFAVLLRGVSQQEAESWASELTATASVITLVSPDGSSKLCLGLKAKAIDLTRDEAVERLPQRQKVKA